MGASELPVPAVAYVGVGSNLGNRESYLSGAFTALQETKGIRKVVASPVYETEAQDCKEPLSYLNAVFAVTTTLGMETFFARLMAIENQFKRQRSYQNAPRTLDLDLLAFAKILSEDPTITLPHPRIQERLFVCVPFLDVASDWVHPRLGLSLEQMLASLRSAASKLAEPVVYQGFNLN